MTALSLAAQEGNVDSLQLLVNGGANVEAKNVRGQTALHLAALAQSPETVEVLLKASKFIFILFFLFNQSTVHSRFSDTFGLSENCH